MRTSNSTLIDTLLAVPVVLILLAPPVFAQAKTPSAPAKGDPAVAAELGYAEWLSSQRFMELAQIVLDRLPKSTGGGWRRTILELQVPAAMGKFDQIIARIKSEPNQDSQDVWAMKLFLGDVYYMWGKYAQSQASFDEFFRRYPDAPPEDLKQFYVETAYKYAQMLIMMDKKKEAVDAYSRLVKQIPPKTKDEDEKAIRRRMLCEMGDLMLKIVDGDPSQKGTYLPTVKKICDEVLWVQDLWFGKAIVLLAHYKFIEGDMAGAQKLVEQYRTQLDQIDEWLRKDEEQSKDPVTRLSPMAECRYLLGVIMQKEAEKLLAEDPKKNREAILDLLAGKKMGGSERSAGALMNFAIVFYDYSSSSWAPDAGARLKRVKEIMVESLKIDASKITVTVPPEKEEEVRKAQFQQARTLLNQQKYADAAEIYLGLLNLYPEGEGALVGLSDLAQCYIELKEDFLPEMTVRYMAERFCQNKALQNKAGDEVLRMAELFGEKPEVRDSIYQLFFRTFTRHPKAPPTLFRFGILKFREKDYGTALGYFKQMEQNFPNSVLYADSLSQQAACYHEQGNISNEIQVLDQYIGILKKKDKPGANMVSASYRLAVARKSQGEQYLGTAIKGFNDVVAMATNAIYVTSGDDAASNAKFLESAIFNRALCYSQLKKPVEKVKEYQVAAARYFLAFVNKYPTSAYAPVSLSMAGALQSAMGNAEETKKILLRLQKEYPGTPEAKNADFNLAMSLLKLNKRDEAIPILKRMFEDAEGKYSSAQIMQAARELMQAKEYEVGADAYARALTLPDMSPAMKDIASTGRGKALIEMGKADEGVKLLEEMAKQKGNSVQIVELRRYLSKAYADMGTREQDEAKRFTLFQGAIKSINEVRKVAARYRSVTNEAVAKTLKAEFLKSNLDAPKLLVLRAKAAEEFGPKDQVKELIGQAINGYNAVIIENPSDPDVKANIEMAILDVIPLAVKLEQWSDIVEWCDKYQELFPNGKHVNEIIRWKSEAKVGLSTSGGPKKPEGTSSADDVRGAEDNDPVKVKEAPKPEKQAEAPDGGKTNETDTK